MAWDNWLFEHIGAWDYLIRIVVACLCGGLVGLERTKRLKEAGIRTHIIVALGAALIMVVSKYGFADVGGADASRIASNVITGISFLGAGVIFVRGGSVKGLTTAAGLWTTGVIGLAIGSGYYELGLLGTALVLVAETWLSRLGSTIQHTPEYGVEVLYNEKTSLDHVLRFCKDNRMSIVNLTIHTAEDVPQAEYIARVRLRGKLRQDALVARIQQMPGIMTAMGL